MVRYHCRHRAGDCQVRELWLKTYIFRLSSKLCRHNIGNLQVKALLHVDNTWEITRQENCVDNRHIDLPTKYLSCWVKIKRSTEISQHAHT